MSSVIISYATLFSVLLTPKLAVASATEHAGNSLPDTFSQDHRCTPINTDIESVALFFHSRWQTCFIFHRIFADAAYKSKNLCEFVSICGKTIKCPVARLVISATGYARKKLFKHVGRHSNSLRFYPK